METVWIPFTRHVANQLYWRERIRQEWRETPIWNGKNHRLWKQSSRNNNLTPEQWNEFSEEMDHALTSAFLFYDFVKKHPSITREEHEILHPDTVWSFHRQYCVYSWFYKKHVACKQIIGNLLAKDEPPIHFEPWRDREITQWFDIVTSILVDFQSLYKDLTNEIQHRIIPADDDLTITNVENLTLQMENVDLTEWSEMIQTLSRDWVKLGHVSTRRKRFSKTKDHMPRLQSILSWLDGRVSTPLLRTGRPITDMAASSETALHATIFAQMDRTKQKKRALGANEPKNEVIEIKVDKEGNTIMTEPKSKFSGKVETDVKLSKKKTFRSVRQRLDDVPPVPAILVKESTGVAAARAATLSSSSSSSSSSASLSVKKQEPVRVKEEEIQYPILTNSLNQETRMVVSAEYDKNAPHKTSATFHFYDAFSDKAPNDSLEAQCPVVRNLGQENWQKARAGKFSRQVIFRDRTDAITITGAKKLCRICEPHIESLAITTRITGKYQPSVPPLFTSAIPESNPNPESESVRNFSSNVGSESEAAENSSSNVIPVSEPTEEKKQEPESQDESEIGRFLSGCREIFNRLLKPVGKKILFPESKLGREVRGAIAICILIAFVVWLLKESSSINLSSVPPKVAIYKSDEFCRASYGPSATGEISADRQFITCKGPVYKDGVPRWSQELKITPDMEKKLVPVATSRGKIPRGLRTLIELDTFEEIGEESIKRILGLKSGEKTVAIGKVFTHLGRLCHFSKEILDETNPIPLLRRFIEQFQSIIDKYVSADPWLVDLKDIFQGAWDALNLPESKPLMIHVDDVVHFCRYYDDLRPAFEVMSETIQVAQTAQEIVRQSSELLSEQCEAGFLAMTLRAAEVPLPPDLLEENEASLVIVSSTPTVSSVSNPNDLPIVVGPTPDSLTSPTVVLGTVASEPLSMTQILSSAQSSLSWSTTGLSIVRNLYTIFHTPNTPLNLAPSTIKDRTEKVCERIVNEEFVAYCDTQAVLNNSKCSLAGFKVGVSRLGRSIASKYHSVRGLCLEVERFMTFLNDFVRSSRGLVTVSGMFVSYGFNMETFIGAWFNNLFSVDTVYYCLVVTMIKARYERRGTLAFVISMALLVFRMLVSVEGTGAIYQDLALFFLSIRNLGRADWIRRIGNLILVCIRWKPNDSSADGSGMDSTDKENARSIVRDWLDGSVPETEGGTGRFKFQTMDQWLKIATLGVEELDKNMALWDKRVQNRQASTRDYNAGLSKAEGYIKRILSWSDMWSQRVRPHIHSFLTRSELVTDPQILLVREIRDKSKQEVLHAFQITSPEPKRSIAIVLNPSERQVEVAQFHVSCSITLWTKLSRLEPVSQATGQDLTKLFPPLVRTVLRFPDELTSHYWIREFIQMWELYAHYSNKRQLSSPFLVLPLLGDLSIKGGSNAPFVLPEDERSLIPGISHVFYLSKHRLSQYVDVEGVIGLNTQQFEQLRFFQTNCMSISTGPIPPGGPGNPYWTGRVPFVLTLEPYVPLDNKDKDEKTESKYNGTESTSSSLAELERNMDALTVSVQEQEPVLEVQHDYSQEEWCQIHPCSSKVEPILFGTEWTRYLRLLCVPLTSDGFLRDVALVPGIEPPVNPSERAIRHVLYQSHHLANSCPKVFRQLGDRHVLFFGNRTLSPDTGIYCRDDYLCQPMAQPYGVTLARSRVNSFAPFLVPTNIFSESDRKNKTTAWAGAVTAIDLVRIVRRAELYHLLMDIPKLQELFLTTPKEEEVIPIDIFMACAKVSEHYRPLIQSLFLESNVDGTYSEEQLVYDRRTVSGTQLLDLYRRYSRIRREDDSNTLEWRKWTRDLIRFMTQFVLEQYIQKELLTERSLISWGLFHTEHGWSDLVHQAVLDERDEKDSEFGRTMNLKMTPHVFDMKHVILNVPSPMLFTGTDKAKQPLITLSLSCKFETNTSLENFVVSALMTFEYNELLNILQSQPKWKKLAPILERKITVVSLQESFRPFTDWIRGEWEKDLLSYANDWFAQTESHSDPFNYSTWEILTGPKSMVLLQHVLSRLKLNNVVCILSQVFIAS